jgi:hypothetical protein
MYVACMADAIDALEQRIDDLRTEVRRSVVAGDRVRASTLRAELRRVEAEWDATLSALAGPDLTEGVGPSQGAPLIPVREQVHQALTFLTVPAAPKLIAALHTALFGGTLVGGQLTSLRRDEEKSFKANPYSRPYYLCAALTADRLSPARGLLAVSTWPLPDRIVGPLSPRVHFLKAAIRVAEHLRDPDWATLPARRLLWEFAANIPGGARTFDSMTPSAVQHAATTELSVHQSTDRQHREDAARRALDNQLDDRQQMFGAPFGLASVSTSDG